MSDLTATRVQREKAGSSTPQASGTSRAILRRRGQWFQFFLIGIVVLLIISNYSNHWLSASGTTTDVRHRESVPEFAFSQLGGGEWRLTDHRGQVILLNFWATWCPPCREETPGLVHLAHQLPSKDVTIVGISMDENPAAVPAFVKAYRIPYQILTPPAGSPAVASIESLPTSLLIDRAGRIARSYVGAVSEAAFSRDIENVLHERTTHVTSAR